MPLVELVIELEREVVVIALAVLIELLGGQSEPGLELIDGGDVGQNDRVVIRILVAPLAFVVAKEKRLVFRNGAAEGEAELVLLQLVEARRGEAAAGPGDSASGRRGDS